MGLLEDLAETASRIGRRVNDVGEALSDWLASENGQATLLGLDFVSLSSRAGDFYEHVGWYLPVHPTLLRYALDHPEHHVPFDARAAARLVGPGSAYWPWLTEALPASPCIAPRAAVVRDAIFCIENERWHAAVCSLLPVIEGVVSDRSGVLHSMRVGRRLDEEILDKQSGSIEAISAASALAVVDTEIFARTPFEDADIDEPTLNRNLVLHGRTAGFGTRVNAIRTLMLLVALAELLDGALLLTSDSTPPSDYSVLDDYGPLAGLRAAARARSNGSP